MPVRIETERLILRPFSVADADDVTAYQSIEECVRYVPFGVRDRDEVLAAFERQRPAEHLNAVGDYFVLGMELKATSRVIGQVNLGFEAAEPKTASFGYLTHRDYWRQGYTREAITALLNYAVGVEQVAQLTAVIVPENEPSIRFAESLGMHLTGTRENVEEHDGSLISLHDYAMPASAWQARSR